MVVAAPGITLTLSNFTAASARIPTTKSIDSLEISFQATTMALDWLGHAQASVVPLPAMPAEYEIDEP